MCCVYEYSLLGVSTYHNPSFIFHTNLKVKKGKSRQNISLLIYLLQHKDWSYNNTKHSKNVHFIDIL